LIDPNAPKRAVEHIAFANQDHRSTQPLIAGSLERKGKIMSSYSTSFYAVTPSKYLHEFKTDDDFAKEPQPETSLYLPDCLIGAVDGVKFNVKGKNSSKGVLSKMSMGHEYHFRAHTPQDAQKWHDVISSVVGQTTNELPTSPVSPAGEQAHQTFPPAETGTVGAAGTGAAASTIPEKSAADPGLSSYEREAAQQAELTPGTATTGTVPATATTAPSTTGYPAEKGVTGEKII